MMTRFSLALLLALLTAGAVFPDSNLHILTGTLEDCGCSYFPVPSPFPCGTPTDPFASCGDWICFAYYEIAAPPEHFSETEPATVTAEIVEQAIGQCGSLYSLLPRKTQLLFWLEAGGYDSVHGGIVRSPIKGYFLVDLGPAE